jgi:hypothetical protein
MSPPPLPFLLHLQVGMVSVAATVSAAAGGGDARAATASVDVKMEVPFQLTHCLRAPQHSHVLLPAAPKVCRQSGGVVNYSAACVWEREPAANQFISTVS